MARQDVAPIVADDAGVVATTTVGHIDGHSILNQGGDVVLILHNSGAGAHVVTIPTPATRDDLAVADRTINLTAGQRKVAGPFTPDIYNQTGADSGELWLNFDASPAEVNVCPVKWPRG